MIKEILENSKNIAVVYLSPESDKASNFVSSYMQRKGYKIFPVFPKEDEILGEKVYRKLEEIPEKIDIVLIFRKSEFASELVKDVVKIQAKTFWLQSGITNEEARKICEENKINFVEDKCIMQEYKKLFRSEKNYSCRI